MPGEAEVLLLPGLPLINQAGENPETDLWTFDVETPDLNSNPDPNASDAAMKGDSPPVMIDYVHPGV